MNRNELKNAFGIGILVTALIVAFIFTCHFAFAEPAGATVVNDVCRLQEFYNNDDMNGTTTVTLQHPCNRWMIHNASATVSMVYTPATATGDASAGITIPPGASLSDEGKSVQDYVQSFRFWSNGTVENQIHAGRDNE